MNKAGLNQERNRQKGEIELLEAQLESLRERSTEDGQSSWQQLVEERGHFKEEAMITQIKWSHMYSKLRTEENVCA